MRGNMWQRIAKRLYAALGYQTPYALKNCPESLDHYRSDTGPNKGWDLTTTGPFPMLLKTVRNHLTTTGPIQVRTRAGIRRQQARSQCS